MEAFVKNVIYLSPPAGLAIAGLGCLWILPSQTLIFGVLCFLCAIALFFWSIKLGKYGYDSLERIAKLNTQTKVDVERERTSRKILTHNNDMQKIQAKKDLGWEKVKQDIGNNAISQIFKQ
ncbi:MAG: hypothetical protein NTY48_04575 [Candidatus Diapherotrites archaeon]|nr:hypothetical protein [Candidatus Diapherotrites archaeon]